MPIKSGPFDGIDRSWKAEDFANYFASFIANGVFPNPSTGLQVYESLNMTVTVKPGKGWINGYFIVNDGDYNLPLANADGVLNRIDRIVMRYENANRQINILVKQGTFASTPVAPTLQRDADYYELALADVYVGKGVTAITQSNITDQRLNTSVCGIVKGLIDQVDTTTIFNQYQSWYQQVTGSTQAEIDAWQAQQEQAFNDWFATVQNTLSGDVAGNLASQITTVQQDLAAHKTEFATFKASTEKSLNDFESTKDLSETRSNKDSFGTYTTITYRRKSDNTLYGTSVLSGGTAPNYTTRTIKRYDVDGTTLLKTIVKTVTYDADGDWTGDV